MEMSEPRIVIGEKEAEAISRVTLTRTVGGNGDWCGEWCGAFVWRRRRSASG